MLTITEENYIKAIYKITEKNQGTASTTAIAKHLSTSAASVTDMLKRLAEKEYFTYEKYKGVYLTPKGIKLATELVRKHRLWEVFLVDKLNFSWEEVHDIAEELEHINSDKLVNALDQFLGHPKYDPHGDPIPNADGKFTIRNQIALTFLDKEQAGVVVGVREHDKPFLEYLNQLEIGLGTRLQVINKIEFDRSMEVLVDNNRSVHVSSATAAHILVKKTGIL